jgi:lipopolysaccharide/colanic/teichoic acid biosynthesis glycosyltransferase
MPRLLEAFIAAGGLIVFSPIMAVLAILIKIQDGGRVFYRAQRVGKAGRPFFLFKFRTMVVGAESIGAGITISGDHRITPIGRFLRKYKLDELPQLLNVLRGDMSFVGPRPEDPRYVALYSHEQKHVLTYRPGITSPASLHFRNEESLLAGPGWHDRYTDTILPKKLSMDLHYCKQRTIGDDLKIILRTIGGILNEKADV